MARPGMTRRHFMSRLLDASAVAIPVLRGGRVLCARAVEPVTRGRSVVLLWMGGGPSTIDLWDLKPGAATGGPFRPIRTSGEALICEHLPMLARQMHHFAIIRSMRTRETDHERGRYYVRTGCIPDPDARKWASPHAWDVTPGRPGDLPQLDREPVSVRARYGEHDFGRGCLMARQLVERGVPFVEVPLSGWDNHHAIFRTLSDRQLPVLDRAMSALVEDLEQRGLLRNTLIVWMGEFGRTPRINNNGGRDHWARAWSILLGGAGIRGGAVIGQTSADGTRVVDDAFAPEDVLATVDRVWRASPDARPASLFRRAGDGLCLRSDGGRVIEAALA